MTLPNTPLLPVVILAGGLATRLGIVARSQPKCMVDVAGRPFLFHQLQLLKNQNINHVILCLGHLGEQVEQAVGDGSLFGLKVHYSYDGTRLVGTGGAIRQALPLLPESFFVLYGDSHLTCSFKQTQVAFQESGRDALMTVFRNEGQWDASNVEFRDGQIIAYDKSNRTPAMQHIDYGLSLFKRTVFEQLPADQPIDLAVIFQDQLKRQQLAAHEVFERFYEIGSHAGLEETRHYLSRSQPVSAEINPENGD